MGLLESLLGDASPPEETEETEHTIELSEEENELVYPVAVDTSELMTYKSVLEYDRETPYGDPEMPESLKKSFDEGWRETTPGEQTWSEEVEQTRAQAEQLIDAWDSHIDGDRGVILMPSGAYYHLSKPLWACEARVDIDDDPFEATDDLLTAASFVKRLRSAEEGDAPAVFAHVDDVPVTHEELHSGSQ